jgi:polar amino acid transport system permease protein
MTEPAPPSTPEAVRPEEIKAIPVRHPGRWVAAAIIAVLVAMFVHLLLTNDSFQWQFMFDNMFTRPVLIGVRTTVLLTILAMAIGIGLGIVIAVMRLSPNPILSGVAFMYTWFFRAVPRLVLCVLFGNLGIVLKELTVGVPFDRQIGSFFGFNMDTTILSIDAATAINGFLAGLLALALSEAAYMAEIVRAGIQSIDSGQTEAATALGMSRTLSTRRIVLPQAMRVIVPPSGNELIAMIKDTSLVAYVPVSTELFFQLSAIGSRTFQVFPMLVAALLWYLALTSVLLVGQYFIERRFARGTARVQGQLIGAGTHGL